MIGKDNYSRLCFPPFICFIHNPVRGLLSPSPISFLSFFIDRAIHAIRFQAPKCFDLCHKLGTVSKRYRKTEIDGLNPHSSSEIMWGLLGFFFVFLKKVSGVLKAYNINHYCQRYLLQCWTPPSQMILRIL